MQPTLPRMVVWAGALALIGGTGSCTQDPLLPEPGGEIVVDFSRSLDRWPTDAWDFIGAEVVGETLTLNLGYTGGCEEHDFWVVAVRGWRELPTTGPTPTAAVPILVAHDAHDDSCEAYVTPALTVDLQPLHRAFDAEFGGSPGRVILRIPTGQGAADTLSLDYLIR